jgi:copper(I)-binding protein
MCMPIRIGRNVSLALLAGACTSAGDTAPRSTPWLLPAAVGENTSMYATLRNPGDTAMVITSIEMDVASSAALRRAVAIDGGTQLETVDSLVIPPYDSVTLRPDGVHIVGFNLVAPLHVDGVIRRSGPACAVSQVSRGSPR